MLAEEYSEVDCPNNDTICITLSGWFAKRIYPKMSINSSITVRLIYSFISGICLTGCISQKEKPPVFSSNIDEIITKIKRIVDFREIKFVGSQQFVSDDSYGLLRVEIIDPPIPIKFETVSQEDSLLRQIGKQISLVVKTNLLIPEDYKLYNIRFIHKDHNWRNSSVTRNYVYESKDL